MNLISVISRFAQQACFAVFLFGFLAPLVAKEAISFKKEVLPILEEKCFRCHKAPYEDERGRLRKPKSGYRMDYRDGLVKGGEYQADGEFEALVPGNAEKSAIYYQTNLPEDDDLHMPTKGKDLTDAEKRMLKAWIDAGADFGTWTGKE